MTIHTSDRLYGLPHKISTTETSRNSIWPIGHPMVESNKFLWNCLCLSPCMGAPKKKDISQVVLEVILDFKDSSQLITPPFLFPPPSTPSLHWHVNPYPFPSLFNSLLHFPPVPSKSSNFVSACTINLHLTYLFFLPQINLVPRFLESQI